jgi:hypothetical protein
MLPDHMQPMQYRPHRLGRLSERERDRVHSLSVSWPPTLWFFSFVDRSLNAIQARTFVGDIREQDEKTPMHRVNLPNFHGSEGAGNMCVGSVGVDMSLPFSKRLGLIMGEILNSTWNDDLLMDFDDTGVTDLLDWADKSKDDAAFWRKMTFRQVVNANDEAETFGSLCSRILG